MSKTKPGDVIVKVDPRYFRPTEVETLLGDPTKAREKLGWTPQISVQELVKEMVLADYSSAKRDALVKLAGFKTFDHRVTRFKLQANKAVAAQTLNLESCPLNLES
jgi:GDPmannose 4,6-dehydratase